jgi:Na+/H+ antiporter NhaC
MDIPNLMVHGYFHQRSNYRSFGDLIIQFIVDALLALIAMLGVRAVSRWRNARTGRARMARG